MRPHLKKAGGRQQCATRSEANKIARVLSASECPGASRCKEPHEGCFTRPVRLAVLVSGGTRRRPIDTLRRRRDESWLIHRCEARERRLGEGPAEAFVVKALKGKSPREYPAGSRANPVVPARNSRKGRSPETAADRVGLSCNSDWYNGRRNGMWVLPGRKARIPSGRRKLRRVNPRSAVGTK